MRKVSALLQCHRSSSTFKVLKSFTSFLFYLLVRCSPPTYHVWQNHFHFHLLLEKSQPLSRYHTLVRSQSSVFTVFFPFFCIYTQLQCYKAKENKEYTQKSKSEVNAWLSSVTCSTKKLCRVCGEVGSGRRTAAPVTSEP